MNKLRPALFTGLKLPPSPTTDSLNAAINRLSSEGAHRSVLFTFSVMLKNYNVPLEPNTYPGLLKACTSLTLYPLGLSLHQCIIVSGFALDSYIASSLIRFYSEFGFVDRARKVFDLMPGKNVVPWSAVIRCYSRAGEIATCFSLFSDMRYQGIEPSSVTLLGIICGDLELIQLQCLHSCALLYGFDSDIVLVNAFMNAYSKCGSIADAEALFELMDHRDTVSWNTLISAYAQNGKMDVIAQLLDRMRIEGRKPDQQALGSLVSATAVWNNLTLGKLVHAKILRAGVALDMYLETSLTVMYLKCGNVKSAVQIFQQAPERDVVQWTALISGLVQNNCADKALTVFQLMSSSGECPSTATIACVLAACAQLGSYKLGTSIHGYLIRQRRPVDIAVQNSLVTMYAKCGHVYQSQAVFDRMGERDVVSWNAIIDGYAQNGYMYKALSLFSAMRSALQRPDAITVVSLLQACASIGVLHQGKWMHSYIIRSSLGLCIMVDTALVDMYSKCGNMVYAQKCFDQMSNHDAFSWSTIIAGYGSHGEGDISLRMYSEFLKDGFKPNDVIFLAVLSACSHKGLVDQGLGLYVSMIEEFRIEPRLEHQACIVDLLCRAGRVNEAYHFYRKTFPQPEFDVMGIILDACRTHGCKEIGDIIAKEMLMSEPKNAGYYVQLAHSYASKNRWNIVGETWIKMRSLGLKKVPAWSCIELCGNITTFFTDHSSHPQNEEIQWMLSTLRWEMGTMDTNIKSRKQFSCCL